VLLSVLATTQVTSEPHPAPVGPEHRITRLYMTRHLQAGGMAEISASRYEVAKSLLARSDRCQPALDLGNALRARNLRSLRRRLADTRVLTAKRDRTGLLARMNRQPEVDQFGAAKSAGVLLRHIRY
jgi:hypothetical protein